jgi:hypothetical protein
VHGAVTALLAAGVATDRLRRNMGAAAREAATPLVLVGQSAKLSRLMRLQFKPASASGCLLPRCRP